MGFASLDVQVEEDHGVIMDHEGFKNSNFPASYSSDEVSSIGSDDDDDDDDSNNNSSSEVTSSLSSSPNSPFSYSNNSGDRPAAVGHSLNDMSSLLQQLPIKRGLSKHFEGKSQSFTNLSNVTCLEDLAKPENPYNKKLKSCKSYVGLYGGYQRSSSNQHMNNIPKSASSRLISKKSSRGSCSSSLLNIAKRNISSRPPSYS